MILLDTHALLWHFGDRAKLSARAASAIARASQIAISAFSVYEVAALVRRGKYRLDRGVFDWGRGLPKEGITDIPVTGLIAASAGALGDQFPADPADRIIYATARELAVPLVTKDRSMRDFAREARDVRVIW